MLRFSHITMIKELQLEMEKFEQIVGFLWSLDRFQLKIVFDIESRDEQARTNDNWTEHLQDTPYLNEDYPTYDYFHNQFKLIAELFQWVAVHTNEDAYVRRYYNEDEEEFQTEIKISINSLE